MYLALLHRLCRKTLWVIALILTGVVCLLNILYTSEVASTGYEYVTVSSHFLRSFPMLVIAGSIVVIAAGVREKLESLDEKKLFGLLTAVYTVMALYLIFNVDNVIRADAKTVFNTALEVKNGIYNAFQPGQYLYRYPHQLGLMVYDRILSAFSENPQFLFFVNFLLVLGINYLGWQISGELFRDKLTNILTIFLSFAFLPQLFFILFAYSLIPGFFFLMMGFYQTLKYVRTENIRNLVIMVLSVGISVLLKQNYLIGGIAIIIWLFLHFLQNKKFRMLAVMAALALSMVLPVEGLKAWYGTAAGVELNNSSPTVLWIAMGTDPDNNQRGPGWYDSSSWNLYNQSGYNTQIASELGKQKLAENWKKMKADPDRACLFFQNKTISQWCDPMYESVWSGPLEDCGQYTHTKILQSLYTGDTWASGITDYLKTLTIGLWVFALLFLIFTGGKQTGWEMLYLYFIGGLLFHMFWEGKSQYTYTYLFVLIPFAAYAFRQAMAKR